ncbi:MAG: hypothetical protein JKY96_00650 [Phycisphaerales bacterium]|nr:hypothetical protein [Phycisphaerales bacterium]
MSAQQALDELKVGNKRFVAHLHHEVPTDNHNRQHELIINQKPIAIIVGCSDARVPPELVFDQGMGDLFVIRVAGNIVMPSQIESVEFAALQFGPRLIVVLGHSQCGALQATIGALKGPPERVADMYPTVVEYVRPSVDAAIEACPNGTDDEILHTATHANVRRSMAELRKGSVSLRRLEAEEGLMVVGAHYAIETGVVEFFEDAKVGPVSKEKTTL